ncbi:LysR family transcriptional regulator [Aminobacter aminovorans]|uniref:LysR family transcriptional regulator n=1 Tax=Aminobacter aminovorans TaxID=83263 RepID=UPI00285D2459|nr:LysR family transcriptional regulator [Aminobacter aminovorans]MDR7219893.1 LysR family glycine cleavage system transcriptional activator [Aminobacter aminovorans]
MTAARTLLPDLGKLQAFEAAARHGNVTLAGRELNLSQSAVSRQIRDLEAQLGLLLFERVRQRVVLSAAGQKFLPDARKLLEQGEAAMLRAMASSGVSLLSLATLPTFGSRWLVPRLPGFLKTHPGIALNVVSRSEQFDLEEQGFDAAIHYGQPVWANAVCRYICREVIVPAASPDFLAGRDIGSPEALAHAPLLNMATRPKAWANWFQAAGVEAQGAYQGHRFDQFTMLIEAAVAGLGVALLPLYLVESELRDGKLQVVLDMPLQTEKSYYFVVPERKAAGQLTNQLFDWIVGQVTPQA